MRIIIASGGTGGHLFPAIRLAEEISARYKHIDILFVASCRRQDSDILKKKGITFKTVPLVGLTSKNIISIVNFIFRLIIGTAKSLFLILWFRPKVVIGFGSYVAGPILLLSSLFRIKTIIHEQNVYPGKTNRILSRFVDRIAISFPKTFEYLKKFESKVVVSGNLLRREITRQHIMHDRFTVLVMGGSQGAHVLNKIVPEVMGLIKSDKKDLLEVIHISGYKEQDFVINAYKNKGVKNRVYPFRDDIHNLYNESDFVIARSGATTVAELLYLAKPSVLIPYPYSGGHQRLNAKVLKDMGRAIVLEEGATFSPEVLRDAIMKLMDRNILINMSSKLNIDDSKDACDILIREIIACG